MTDYEDEVRRGEVAARILAEPLLQAAFNDLEASYIDAMMQIPGVSEKEQRRIMRLRDAAAVARKVRSQLEAHIKNGEFAKHQIKEMERTNEKRFRVI